MGSQQKRRSGKTPASRKVSKIAPQAIKGSLMNPRSVKDVLALPSHLSVLQSIEVTTGRPFESLSLAKQDAVTFRRLQQQVNVVRINSTWNSRLRQAGVPAHIKTWQDWESIPVTDKDTFSAMFTGERTGMVVPISSGGFEVVASGGTSSGKPSETVYDLGELRDTYLWAGRFIGRHMLPPNMGPNRPRWLATTLADYQMWSSGTMVGGVLQYAPDVNYIGAGPMSADVFHHMMRYQGPKAIMGISESIAYLVVLGTGLEEQARSSLRIAMYGSGQLTKKARAELVEMYPNVRALSYFAATQAEAIGLQIVPDCETLVTVPGLHHIEILDDFGRMVEVGQEGELVVTRLLANQAPVLRYKVGDRVRRLPDLVTGELKAHQFAFIGRSGDFLHIGDTQYAARTALRAILAAVMDATGVDLEDTALELQFVNERNRKALVLVAACAQAEEVRKSISEKIGPEGAGPLIMSAITQALSVFNSLEANVGALKATGYFFGLSIVARDSPELKRTEVGKVPLVVDVL